MDTMERYDRDMFPLGMDDGMIERFKQVHQMMIKALVGHTNQSRLSELRARLLSLLTDILLRLEAIERRLDTEKLLDRDIPTFSNPVP